jgi:hypothetical protein
MAAKKSAKKLSKGKKLPKTKTLSLTRGSEFQWGRG